MSYYQKHVFICTNLREAGKQCCQVSGDATAMSDYFKKKIKSLGLSGRQKVRVSRSGCLGRCELGPVLVIYPEGVWYTYTDTDDLDEIIEKHIVEGEVVQRLLLSDK